MRIWGCSRWWAKSRRVGGKAGQSGLVGEGTRRLVEAVAGNSWSDLGQGGGLGKSAAGSGPVGDRGQVECYTKCVA